ncbi:MAG: hypothetical protein V4510_03005 [bacterium]
MGTLDLIWKWLDDNGPALAVILAFVPLAWATSSYLSVKRQELRERRFAAFHQLIQKLVEPENPNLPMKLDRQVAIVFELRNFKEYYPVTLRIFKGLRETWAEQGPERKRARLDAELELAIDYIEGKV